MILKSRRSARTGTKEMFTVIRKIYLGWWDERHAHKRQNVWQQHYCQSRKCLYKNGDLNGIVKYILRMWELGDIKDDRWTFVKLILPKNDFWLQTGIETATFWWTWRHSGHWSYHLAVSLSEGETWTEDPGMTR